MQKRKLIHPGAGTLKEDAVRNPGTLPKKGRTGEFADIGSRGGDAASQAKPAESDYDRQMRLMREIGKADKKILAALAK